MRPISNFQTVNRGLTSLFLEGQFRLRCRLRRFFRLSGRVVSDDPIKNRGWLKNLVRTLDLPF